MNKEKSNIIDPVITKSAAIKAAGGKAVYVSRALGIKRSSVSMWKETVPTLRAHQLIKLFPELAKDQPSANE